MGFCPDAPQNIFLIGAYLGLMVYGLVSLASFWAFIHVKQRGDRDISDGWFILFGLALPVSGFLLSLFSVWGALILPASLAILFYQTAAQEWGEARLLRAENDEELRHADKMILDDANNAAAYWGKAKVYESRGFYDEAWRHYYLAHRLCDRALPAHELDEIKTRLIHAKDAARGGRAAGALGSPLRSWLRLELVFFFLGCGLLFWNWAFGLNVCGVMLFDCWLFSRR